MKFIALPLLAFSLLMTTPYSQATAIKVVALFSDKAMVIIDGQRQLLRASGHSVNGVRLLKADSKTALLEVDGKQRRVRLSRDMSGSISDPVVKTLRINRNNNGQYIYQGTINGRSIDMLLDTGANVVAMNATDADRLGVRYQDAERIRVDTASSTVSAYSVVLPAVSLGGIRVSNVEATVIEGNYPDKVLLGVSFLKHVRFREDQGVMVLEAKY